MLDGFGLKLFEVTANDHRMKIFMLLCALTVAAFGAATDSLAKIKAKFPEHIAGKVTESSDPHILTCYRKYKDLIDRTTVQNLPDMIVRMRQSIDLDIRLSESKFRDRNNVLNAQAKMAIRQNISWLKQEMIPYVHELALVQMDKR